MTSNNKVVPSDKGKVVTPRADLAELGVEQDELPQESWITRDSMCIRMPLVRIFFTWAIIAVDFYIFGEDPIQDSYSEANLPFVGNIVTFLLGGQDSSGGWYTLRILLIIIAFILGNYIGTRWIHHWLLQKKCKLRMFNEYRGSFLVATLCFLAFTYFFSMLYNLMDPNVANHATSAMGIKNRIFGKIAQCGTWLGDIITVVMVFDSIFQDRTYYPNWCVKSKDIWMKGCKGALRVIVVWLFFLGTTFGVFWSIWQVGEGKSAWPGHSNEIMRIFVVDMVTIIDVTIVFQDWEFPTFNDHDDDDQPPIMIAGSFVHELDCTCIQGCVGKLTKCCTKIPCIRWLRDANYFNFVVSGKWLNYGPLFVILGLDLNMLKNQVLYEPQPYGQYWAPDGYLYTIMDVDYLDKYFDQGVLQNASMITYEAREAWMLNGTDPRSTAFIGASFTTKCACAIPAMVAMLGFMILVAYGNCLYVEDKDGKWYRKSVIKSIIKTHDASPRSPRSAGTGNHNPETPLFKANADVLLEDEDTDKQVLMPVQGDLPEELTAPPKNTPRKTTK